MLYAMIRYNYQTREKRSKQMVCCGSSATSDDRDSPLSTVALYNRRRRMSAACCGSCRTSSQPKIGLVRLAAIACVNLLDMDFLLTCQQMICGDLATTDVGDTTTGASRIQCDENCTTAANNNSSFVLLKDDDSDSMPSLKLT
jgi:hypothetical protein